MKNNNSALKWLRSLLPLALFLFALGTTAQNYPPLFSYTQKASHKKETNQLTFKTSGSQRLITVADLEGLTVGTAIFGSATEGHYQVHGDDKAYFEHDPTAKNKVILRNFMGKYDVRFKLVTLPSLGFGAPRQALELDCDFNDFKRCGVREYQEINETTKLYVTYCKIYSTQEYGYGNWSEGRYNTNVDKYDGRPWAEIYEFTHNGTIMWLPYSKDLRMDWSGTTNCSSNMDPGEAVVGAICYEPTTDPYRGEIYFNENNDGLNDITIRFSKDAMYLVEYYKPNNNTGNLGGGIGGGVLPLNEGTIPGQIDTDKQTANVYGEIVLKCFKNNNRHSYGETYTRRGHLSKDYIIHTPPSSGPIISLTPWDKYSVVNFCHEGICVGSPYQDVYKSDMYVTGRYHYKPGYINQQLFTHKLDDRVLGVKVEDYNYKFVGFREFRMCQDRHRYRPSSQTIWDSFPLDEDYTEPIGPVFIFGRKYTYVKNWFNQFGVNNSLGNAFMWYNDHMTYKDPSTSPFGRKYRAKDGSYYYGVPGADQDFTDKATDINYVQHTLHFINDKHPEYESYWGNVSGIQLLYKKKKLVYETNNSYNTPWDPKHECRLRYQVLSNGNDYTYLWDSIAPDLGNLRCRVHNESWLTWHIVTPDSTKTYHTQVNREEKEPVYYASNLTMGSDTWIDSKTGIHLQGTILHPWSMTADMMLDRKYSLFLVPGYIGDVQVHGSYLPKTMNQRFSLRTYLSKSYDKDQIVPMMLTPDIGLDMAIDLTPYMSIGAVYDSPSDGIGCEFTIDIKPADFQAEMKRLGWPIKGQDLKCYTLYMGNDYKSTVASPNGRTFSRLLDRDRRENPEFSDKQKKAPQRNLGLEELPELTGRYDVYGLPVGEDYKGLVIEVYSDGSTRKTLVE